MLKIAGVVLCEILIYTLLKQYKPEFAVISQAVSMVVLLFLLGDETEKALSSLQEFLGAGAIPSAYINILLKVLGISLITQFTADMCRDSGESAMASKVEFAGKIIIVGTGLPVIEGFTGLISGMAEGL